MIDLRPYQIPAVDALSQCHRGILKAPAGSGKTVIAATALELFFRAWIQRHGKSKPPLKVAWVANTTEQIAQARKALDAYFICRQLLNSTNPNTHKIYLYCYAGCPSLSGYDLVILDECHHISAPEYRNALKYHEGARWGLSATPDRSDDLKKDVYDLIGPIIYTIERESLVKAGQLASAHVYVHSPNTKGQMETIIANTAAPMLAARKKKWPFLFSNPKSSEEQFRRIVWQCALNIGIEDNKERNDLTVSIAKRHKEDSLLILVSKIEHGQVFEIRIPGSKMVFSKMGARKRREVIAAFAAGELRCLIATSLADEGLDVPRANVLIQVAGGRSSAKAEQRTGRVLRSFKDGDGKSKTHGIIHDFSDLQHYFLSAQARQRFAVYSRLGYQITHL